MFRLLKLCVGLAAFVAFCWFGATVELGSHTLFGHLRAISETKESHELVDGTKQAAGPLVDGVKRRVTGKPDPAAPGTSPDGDRPQEKVSTADRQKLRRVIGSAENTTAHR